MPWTPPEGAPEEYYASLPFAEAQARLGLTGALPKTLRRATCGWYGTRTHPLRGSFALARTGGPLEDLVGERLKVSHRPAGRQAALSVYVYCVAEGDVLEDVSLTRRAFAELSLLSAEELAVTVEVMG